MTDWNNGTGLYRIASGANAGDYHWTEVLMRDIPTNLLEGVALHSYSVIDWSNKGSATGFTKKTVFPDHATGIAYGRTCYQAFSDHG